jgi:hypothetical protein
VVEDNPTITIPLSADHHSLVEQLLPGTLKGETLVIITNRIQHKVRVDLVDILIVIEGLMEDQVWLLLHTISKTL